MAKSLKLGRFGEWVLKGLVVVSVTWTFFSLIMLLKWELTRPTPTNSETGLSYSEVKLPVLSPSLLYQHLPGVQQSFERFRSATDSVDQPVRIAVVFQRDSTCFVEMTEVSDCGCPAEKVDRYEITRTAIDPVTGIILTRLKEENLSAERLARYFGGLTRIRRFQ